MDEKVRNYLASKQRERQAEKEQFLISLGLYEKEYSPDGTESPTYNLYDASTQTYYRQIPCDVTPEEFQLIRDASKETVPLENTVAKAITVIAIMIYICSFLGGIFLGKETIVYTSFSRSYTSSEFSFKILLMYWISGAIIGTLLLGFAEIIKLLNKLTLNQRG